MKRTRRICNNFQRGRMGYHVSVFFLTVLNTSCKNINERDKTRYLSKPGENRDNVCLSKSAEYRKSKKTIT